MVAFACDEMTQGRSGLRYMSDTGQRLKCIVNASDLKDGCGKCGNCLEYARRIRGEDHGMWCSYWGRRDKTKPCFCFANDWTRMSEIMKNDDPALCDVPLGG